ncbi:DNA adenine methylase [Nocardioides maradonensis]
MHAPDPVTPLVPYHGGKGRLAPWIASLLPPHRVYVEPFAGSAAVLLAKAPAIHEVLNDIDGNAVAFYRVLRDQPEELERVCRLTPYSREEFARADLAEDGLSDLERARRWWVRTNQSFAHTGSTRTGWSTSIKRGSNNARTVLNRIDRFEAAARRLGTVTLESMDAVELIERYSVSDGVIYADPPYLVTTRTTMTKRPMGDYVHEFASEEDHRRLAKALQASCSTVLLSGYHSPLYDELYADWHRTERRVLRRTSNGRSAAQVHTVEVIWSNRPIDVQTSINFDSPHLVDDTDDEHERDETTQH